MTSSLLVTLKNPNVSDEAKQSAQERLDNNEFPSSAESNGEKNENNGVGGKKAAINNPNTSEEQLQQEISA